eukprot:CAMPEP_0179336428 /NCGR_PEP_ID=MMETSP0797-20121207/67038_1 /TAXON_ID=47934 /ORGANISM="Dinophysis acuminata, Strain DAEP01" /LENGTH=36 /DNA_ID= /DNA_START= /DNA_END= /DNA_ORIENTATION=
MHPNEVMNESSVAEPSRQHLRICAFPPGGAQSAAHG